MPKRPARFFKTPDDFRRWLEGNHTTAPDLWVGFHRTTSGKPSITWPQSVDEALCVGWIDGLRQSIDETSYRIRFTPRRNGSVWSTINVARVKALTEAGRMRPPGLKAHEARKEHRTGIYSFENRPADLPAAYAKRFRANKAAWKYFSGEAPSYRRAAIWWVVSAKKEETRERRLALLIADSAAGKRLAQYTWEVKSTGPRAVKARP